MYPCTYVFLYLYIYTPKLLCFYTSILRNSYTGQRAYGKSIVMQYYTHILIYFLTHAILYACNDMPVYLCTYVLIHLYFHTPMFLYSETYTQGTGHWAQGTGSGHSYALLYLHTYIIVYPCGHRLQCTGHGAKGIVMH